MAIVGVALLALSPRASASPLRRLVMPGPLIADHAEYEADCGNCHHPFSKERQGRLCLGCHEEVAADIAGTLGYHGRIDEIDEIECKQCHAEHLGRGADIVQLDVETFDHGATDFVLLGRHAQAACRGCHADGGHYRDADSSCDDCHRGDDAHQGRLGSACRDCHAPVGWSQARFEHDQTSFPLEGQHVEVACNRCHPDEQYQDTPAQCRSCHEMQDVHGGRHGRQCETCHTPVDWSEQAFDHDHDTGFPLTGSHRGLACADCHPGDVFEQNLETDCHACHRQDDVHGGRRGTACSDCHDSSDWDRPLFDHDAATEFPLSGRHAGADCEACHRGNVFDDEPATDCYGCHRHDDVHDGQEGTRCDTCHDENGWSATVTFDHDLGAFPLIGVHAVTPCEECHLTPEFKDAASECIACHADDDDHRRRLATDCARCHNPNAWALWIFDHDTQTDYILDGAHEGLECVACHLSPVRSEIHLSTACHGCHRTDDIHRGGFGRLCSRCHVTDSFATIKQRSGR